MRALVLSITAGQGHNATAKAIVTKLESLGCHAQMLDTFDYLSHALCEAVSRGYLLMANNAKLVYKGGYRLAEKRSKSTTDISPTRATGNIMSRKLAKYINAYNPDIIICTHVFPTIILDIMKQRGELHAKTISVLTDFMFHPYWEEGCHIDYIVTPNEQLLSQAIRKGFKKTQVLPFGIPIQPKFAEPPMSKKQARIELGLDPNKHTVLFMSGGMGHGNMEKTVKALDRVPKDFQMIVVCGNNRKAKARIDKLETNKKILNLGFVDYVDKLMDASDCIVSKPGGLTTSEALAKRLPMIIVDPIPGQEDRNTEFLTNNGVAMAATATTPIDEVVYQLFANPKRIEVMQSAIDLIAKPNSTSDMCKFAVSICEKEKH